MDKIILGLDPGTLLMGFGAVMIKNYEPVLLDFGEIHLRDIEDPYARLSFIITKTKDLIQEFKPHECAIEAPFFGKNVQSMLKLGRAQGVAIATIINCGRTVVEYSPREIKQSITGKGNATKEQVWMMLKKMMNIHFEPKHYDGTDALAVAVCHYFKTSNAFSVKGNKSKNAWETFIKNNPGRIN